MLRVLTYHRVAEPDDTPWLHPRLVSATPHVFGQHVQHLAARYRVVSLPQVLAATRGHGALPARAVLVTFDDGYRDFQDVAWPILQAHGLPVTLFVPTGFPTGRPFWWDRLHRGFVFTTRGAIDIAGLGRLPLENMAARRTSLAAVQQHVKSLPHEEAMALVERCGEVLGEPPHDRNDVLSWDELRALSRQGVSVCAHSRTHPLLTRLGPAEVRAEVQGSMQDLERELGSPPLPVFSYPNGAHDDEVVRVLRELGIELAFTQIDGHNDLGRNDRLRLHRTNITRRSTPAVFRLRLLRWMTVVDRWRHRERHSPSTAAVR